MRIVLDATTVIAEGYGRSARFRTLLSASAAAGYTVYIPRVAIAETAGKFSRELDRHSQSARRTLGQLSRLLGERPESPDLKIDPEAETTLFEEALLEQLSDADVSILPYPEVAHEELANRAISRKRPFDEKGSGYRDALIWFSILRLASESDDPILLVAGDEDFGDGKKGVLHSDLIDDLICNGHPHDRVLLSKSLAQVIDEYIRPSLTEIFWVDPQATLMILAFDIQDSVESAIEYEYEDQEWDPQELGLPPECVEPDLEKVKWLELINVVDVRQLPNHKFLVRVEASVLATFEVFLLRSNSRILREDPRFRVTQLDWNAESWTVDVILALRAVVDLVVHEFNPREHQAQAVSMEPLVEVE